MHFKHLAVIEFLVGEGEKTTSVHEHLLGLCGETTLDVSTV